MVRSHGGPYSGYALALDFKNGAYWSAGANAGSLASVPGYTYTRSGAKQEFTAGIGVSASFAANVPAVVPAVGYYSDGAFTNLLLNAGQSSNLGTQSVTVTAQSYTLSFIGTGSVTLSGTATATLTGTGANNRVSLTFTPTAGTLTLTVTGTVQYAGLVTGALPGPIIPTSGTTAAVGLDSLLVSSPITSEQDFLFYAVCNSNHLLNATSDEVYAALSDGTTANNIILERAANGHIAARLRVAGADTFIDPGYVGVAERMVALLRRRGGKWTFAYKNGAGTVSVGAEQGATTFPSGISKVSVGMSPSAVSAVTNSPVEIVGVKIGTFSDVDLTNLLTAA